MRSLICFKGHHTDNQNEQLTGRRWINSKNATAASQCGGGKADETVQLSSRKWNLATGESYFYIQRKRGQEKNE